MLLDERDGVAGASRCGCGIEISAEHRVADGDDSSKVIDSRSAEMGILIVARASCEEHPASHGDFTARSTKRGPVRDPIAAVTGAREG